MTAAAEISKLPNAQGVPHWTILFINVGKQTSSSNKLLDAYAEGTIDLSKPLKSSSSSAEVTSPLAQSTESTSPLANKTKVSICGFETHAREFANKWLAEHSGTATNTQVTNGFRLTVEYVVK
jgi:hypothetical protein